MVLIEPFVPPLYFRFPNLVPRANSSSITMWSLPSYRRGAFGLIWDIGRVPSRNFDWLPFTPSLWPPYPVLQFLYNHPVHLTKLGVRSGQEGPLQVAALVQGCPTVMVEGTDGLAHSTDLFQLLSSTFPSTGNSNVVVSGPSCPDSPSPKSWARH
jgi:hypothetical protein